MRSTLDIAVIDAGAQTLKNISNPVRTYQIERRRPRPSPPRRCRPPPATRLAVRALSLGS